MECHSWSGITSVVVTIRATPRAGDHVPLRIEADTTRLTQPLNLDSSTSVAGALLVDAGGRCG